MIKNKLVLRIIFGVVMFGSAFTGAWWIIFPVGLICAWYYRKYFEFGKVLLGFTHGDKGSNYPMLMATERSDAWSRTSFREIHTGHRHCDKVTEDHGVKVRILPALCPPDDWHQEHGYVENQRQAEAFIWNKDQGLVATVLYNDAAFDTLKTKRVLA